MTFTIKHILSSFATTSIFLLYTGCASQPSYKSAYCESNQPSSSCDPVGIWHFSDDFKQQKQENSKDINSTAKKQNHSENIQSHQASVIEAKKYSSNIDAAQIRGEINDALSISSHASECALNKSAQACLLAGDYYYSGGAGDEKRANAIQAYKVACDKNLMASCNRLGNLFFEGKLIAQDVVKARSLFERACSAHDGNACASLAFLYMNGIGIEKSDGLGVIHLEKACNLNIGAACNTLGEMYKDAANNSYSTKYFNDACRLGYSDGCDNSRFWQIKLAQAKSNQKAQERQMQRQSRTASWSINDTLLLLGGLLGGYTQGRYGLAPTYIPTPTPKYNSPQNSVNDSNSGHTSPIKIEAPSIRCRSQQIGHQIYTTCN